MLADELTRRCRRRARVFQRPHGEREQRIMTTSSTGGRAAVDSRGGVGSASTDRSELFDGYIEVAYGGSDGRLGARVELWASDGQRFRSVRSVAWSALDSSSDRVELQPAAYEAIAWTSEPAPTSTSAEIVAHALADAVRDITTSFRAAQVAALMEEAPPRARFEYELLQHNAELDVVCVKGRNVQFALPLLNQETDTSSAPAPADADADADEPYWPQTLNCPVVEQQNDKTLIEIRLPMLVSVDDTESKAASPVDEVGSCEVALSWSPQLKLSSQVTEIPHASADMSSMDLISICKLAFLKQWRMRRDFIGELRQRVMVLEYDPVDFSRVFFMLQEQLDPQSPLRILVLSLSFTPGFFLTHDLGDLSVTLLDGRADSTSISLSSSDSIVDSLDNMSDAVSKVVESVQTALIRHFYDVN